ncbi:MAG: hypothetical protein LUC93_17265 [Planctomycetaceae bacterium]|nr:hypothetical protein [Planctomycetaceae bacterium]
MTKTGNKLRTLAVTALLLVFFAGCGREVEPFPEPGASSESAEIIRAEAIGPVILAYASYPLKSGAPPDGVRMAVYRAIGNTRLSAAAFFYSERDKAMDWVREQLDLRRRRNLPPRIILAGHGLGATEASETAREILFNDRDVQIVLLLTVDAVKTGRLSHAAGVTGNVLSRRIPGVNHSFTAYDAAPPPDANRLWAHINYYQTNSTNYHGTSMPGAENHQLTDWTGLLNHGNADDYATSFMVGDLRHAIAESLR